MTITADHWLSTAVRRPLAGGSVMDTRRFLVIHFTAGATAASSIAYWRTPAAKGASAHIVIDRDGTIFQCRPFNRTAGHAGASRWKDPKTGIRYSALNSCSIGIELANAGDAARPDGTAFRGFKLPAGTLLAIHKNGGRPKHWEVYPEAQLTAAFDLSAALVACYNLDDVIGHEDIAPTRKNDPGPAFPMSSLRAHCGFPPAIPKLS